MSAPPPEPDPPVYDPGAIVLISEREAIRRRPGMYIGGTGVAGLQELLSVVLDVALNEHIAGRCEEVRVSLLPDNGYQVWFDSAKPFCLAKNAADLPRFAEAISDRTELYPLLATSLVGFGLRVAIALSRRFEIAVSDGHEMRRQRFPLGDSGGETECEPTAESAATAVTFWPDPEVFRDNPRLRPSTLATRCQELSFLLPRLTIRLADESLKRPWKRSYRSTAGLVDFVRRAATLRADPAVHANIFFAEGSREKIRWQAALQWHAGQSTQIRSFANLGETISGGTHVDRLSMSLTKVLRKHGHNYGPLQQVRWRNEDVQKGVSGVVAVMLPEAQFPTARRSRLDNAEVIGVMDQIIQREFTLFLEANPSDACAIVNRVIQACQEREAASAARKKRKK